MLCLSRLVVALDERREDYCNWKIGESKGDDVV